MVRASALRDGHGALECVMFARVLLDRRQKFERRRLAAGRARIRLLRLHRPGWTPT